MVTCIFSPYARKDEPERFANSPRPGTPWSVMREYMYLLTKSKKKMKKEIKKDIF